VNKTRGSQAAETGNAADLGLGSAVALNHSPT
jgi:hypothetical protein